MLLNFLATSNFGDNHPNKNGELLAAIKGSIYSLEHPTLEKLSARVNQVLKEQLPGLSGTQWSFTHRFNSESRKITVCTSPNLLCWLIANQTDRIRPMIDYIIQNYDFESGDPIDQKGNTIFHIASFYGDYRTLKELFQKAVASPSSSAESVPHHALTKAINQRNQQGTSPLGMAYLNQNLRTIRPRAKKTLFLKTVSLFCAHPDIKINAFLNNKVGMDYQSEPWIQAIGGYNCLHMSIKHAHIEIVQCLKERNLSIMAGRITGAIVNFSFPTLNPAAHMHSPVKLAKLLEFSRIHRQLPTLLQTCQQEEAKHYDEDTSGDSSDPDSHASFYSRELLRMRAEIDTFPSEKVMDEEALFDELNTSYRQPPESVNPELQKLVDSIMIPHFHGIPFMAGHYTHHERRIVARKLLGNSSDAKKYRHLHSRTATTTAGIENLFIFVESDERTLLKLDQVDQALKDYLSECWAINPDSFLEAVRTYIYDFSSNPIIPFWDALGKIKKADSSIIKYRFPFISTSKAPDHPIKFAFGVNVETQNNDEKQMQPDYDKDGKPKHRFVGLVYITLHTLSEYRALEENKECADMPIFIKYGISPTKNVRTDFQIETAFLSHISEENIAAVVPMVYPSFKKFRKGYHDKIWKFRYPGSKELNHFNKIKEKVKTNVGLYGRKTQRERGEKGSQIEPFGKALQFAYNPFLIDLARALAAKQGKKLCYISNEGKVYPYPTSFTRTDDKYESEAQLSIRERMTPETQRTPKEFPEAQNRLHRHLSSSSPASSSSPTSRVPKSGEINVIPFSVESKSSVSYPWYTEGDIQAYLEEAIKEGDLKGHGDWVYRIDTIRTSKTLRDATDKHRYHLFLLPPIDTLQDAYRQPFGQIQISSLPLTYHFNSKTRGENELIQLIERGCVENTRESFVNVLEEATTKEKPYETLHELVNKYGDWQSLKKALESLVSRELGVDVVDELVSAFKEEGHVFRAKILFAFNQELVHWLTGELIINQKIENDVPHYSVKAFTHDPYGKGEMPEKTAHAFQQALLEKLTSIHPETTVEFVKEVSPYEPRQDSNDGVSCGVITAEDIMKRFYGSSLNLDHTYPYGAPKLRAKQKATTVIQEDEDFPEEGVIPIPELSEAASSVPPVSDSELEQIWLTLSNFKESESPSGREIYFSLCKAIGDENAYRDGSYKRGILNCLKNMPISLRQEQKCLPENLLYLLVQLDYAFFNPIGLLKGQYDALFRLQDRIKKDGAP